MGMFCRYISSERAVLGGVFYVMNSKADRLDLNHLHSLLSLLSSICRALKSWDIFSCGCIPFLPSVLPILASCILG